MPTVTPMTVFITGASRGLGLELTRQYAARGEHVIAAVRDPDRAAEARRHARQVLALDVGDPASIARAAAALAGTPIDILVNNAGIFGKDPTPDTLSAEIFASVFATNVAGPALVTRALAGNLRAGSRRLVANITSELGSLAQATPGFSYAYCASKSALNMVSAKLAKDLSGDRITVIAFCPGWNRTDMGGPGAPLDPADSMRSLIATMDRMTQADSGACMRIDGSTIPW